MSRAATGGCGWVLGECARVCDGCVTKCWASAAIETFAQVTDLDELTVYRALVIADRDAVRVCAAAGDDGSVTLNDGAALVAGTRDMLLSAACSLRDQRPVYRAGENQKAAALLTRGGQRQSVVAVLEREGQSRRFARPRPRAGRLDG